MQRASSPKSPPSWCRSGKFTRTSLRGFPLIKRMTLLAKKEAMSVGLSEFLCSRLRVGSIHSDGPAPHITRQVV